MKVLLFFWGVLIISELAYARPSSGIGVTFGIEEPSLLSNGSVELEYQHAFPGNAAASYFYRESGDEFLIDPGLRIIGIGIRIWGSDHVYLGTQGGTFSLKNALIPNQQVWGILSGMMIGFEKGGLILRYENNRLTPVTRLNSVVLGPIMEARVAFGFRFQFE